MTAYTTIYVGTAEQIWSQISYIRLIRVCPWSDRSLDNMQRGEYIRRQFSWVFECSANFWTQTLSTLVLRSILRVIKLWTASGDSNSPLPLSKWPVCYRYWQAMTSKVSQNIVLRYSCMNVYMMTTPPSLLPSSFCTPIPSQIRISSLIIYNTIYQPD